MGPVLKWGVGHPAMVGGQISSGIGERDRTSLDWEGTTLTLGCVHILRQAYRS